MSKIQTVRFIFAKISTDEFAILGESYDATKLADIKVELGLNFIKDQKTLAVKAKCAFHQQDKIFIVIAVTCFFTIDPTDWEHIYSEETRSFYFPKDAAIHLAGLTIGVARGVLHVKTENHTLNSMVLPPILVQDMITDDVNIPEQEPALI